MEINLSNGEKISYFSYCFNDDKEVNFLIHGNMTSKEIMIKLGKSLGKNFIAPDLRGFGESSYKNRIKSVYDLSEDMALLIKELNLDKINLIGWSLGGGVLMELLKNPKVKNRIKSGVFLSSMGIRGLKKTNDNLGSDLYKSFLNFNIFSAYNDYIKNINRDYLYTYNEMKNLYKSAFFDVEADLRKISIENIFKRVLFNRHMPDSSTIDFFVSQALKQKNLSDVNGAVRSFDYEGKSDVPLFFLHGKYDLVVPLEIMFENLDYFGKNNKYKVFEDSGHCIFVDCYDDLVKTLKDFYGGF